MGTFQQLIARRRKVRERIQQELEVEEQYRRELRTVNRFDDLNADRASDPIVIKDPSGTVEQHPRGAPSSRLTYNAIQRRKSILERLSVEHPEVELDLRWAEAFDIFAPEAEAPVPVLPPTVSELRLTDLRHNLLYLLYGRALLRGEAGAYIPWCRMLCLRSTVLLYTQRRLAPQIVQEWYHGPMPDPDAVRKIAGMPLLYSRDTEHAFKELTDGVEHLPELIDHLLRLYSAAVEIEREAAQTMGESLIDDSPVPFPNHYWKFDQMPLSIAVSRYLAKGKGLREIAKLYGVPRRALQAAVKTAPQLKTVPTARDSQHILNAAVAAYRRGDGGIDALAKKYDLPRNYFRDVIRERKKRWK